MKIIGLISGTSSDGIDAALVSIQRKGGSIRLLDFAIYPYPIKLQQELIALASGKPLSIAPLCHLNFYLGERFAHAAFQIAKKARVSLSEIKLIGSHGQTICHLPVPKREGRWSIRSTLQIGEPSIIAERTGITTVADFRPRDIAARGEGAPLTPLLHWHLFGHNRKSRVIVNIGGISNVTFLKAGGKMDTVRAFDTGPGNMLMDGLTRSLFHKRIDHHGKIARGGRVNQPLLSDLMRHSFIRKRPPKSTGRETFGASMIETILSQSHFLPAEDIIKTATAFTAAAIAYNLKQFILREGPIDEVVAGGGGVRNPVLMECLAESLAPIPLYPFESLGFDSRAIEATAFALLAYQAWHGRPANIPSVTGAKKAVILGKIIPGQKGW